MASISDIIKRNQYTPETIPTLENKLFFEGERQGRYRVRFAVLLFLSTVIAANGVIEDSTATVIGAMIIAPLMTPILATTAALVMGNPRRALRSALLVAAGAAAVVALAAVLGAIAFQVIDFRTNSQITGRVAPRVLDLLVALAAGAAGAFATSRDDVADSIPGVAISIALVPPLCVVGICLAGGEWVDAGGAALLFVTNFLSILLAGGAIFGILGLGAAATATRERRDRRRAYRVIALGVAGILIPLSTTTVGVFRDSIAQSRIKQIANEWVGQYPTDFVVRSVLVSRGAAKIIVMGSETPRTIDDLGIRIRSEVKQVRKVDLRFIPSQDFRYPSEVAR